MLHFDGDIQRAMIRSGYLDRIPPLGALNHAAEDLPRLRITLGGEEFPFRLYGYSEHRPDRELSEILVDQDYRDVGWQVYWGPAYTSESEGHIRTFKLTVVTPEELTKEG